MTDRRDQRAVEALREAWGKPTLSPNEQVAFDEELATRLVPGRRVWVWGFAAAIATATAIAWVAWPTAPEAPAPRVELAAQATTDQNDWLTWVSGPDPDDALESMVPDDYHALAYWVAPPSDPSGSSQTQKAPSGQH